MHAAQIIAEPVHGDRTAAGLPVRVPRANLIAGSAGGHRAGGGYQPPGRWPRHAGCPRHAGAAIT